MADREGTFPMKKSGTITGALALALAAMGAAAPAEAAGSGPISELRLGVMAHDQGIFSSNKEDGVDINAEALFTDLGWLGEKIALRPHIGGMINTNGNTSYGYFGLTATAPIGRLFFAEFSVGGAVHSGNLHDNEIGRKDLGCRVLFRESLSFGVNIDEHNSIAAVADHISNANLCDKNEGLETVGVRYAYRF
jgi:lipid A 3-O-deacylase